MSWMNMTAISTCTHSHTQTQSMSTITHHPNITGQPDDPSPSWWPWRPRHHGNPVTYPVQPISCQGDNLGAHLTIAPSLPPFCWDEASDRYSITQNSGAREGEGERGRERERDWGSALSRKIKAGRTADKGSVCVCVCFIMRRHISVILESWLQGMFVILFLEVWFCVCLWALFIIKMKQRLNVTREFIKDFTAARLLLLFHIKTQTVYIYNSLYKYIRCYRPFVSISVCAGTL